MTKRKEYPTQEKLRELFDYDPAGFLVWRKFTGNKNRDARYGGKRAGTSGVYESSSGGFTIPSSICIDGKRYRQRDIIWIFHKGEIPVGVSVSSLSGNFSHKIENLYLNKSSSAISGFPITPSGRVKYLGVHKMDTESGALYICQFGYERKSGERQYKGAFTTAEAAAACYDFHCLNFFGDNAVINGVSCDFEKYRRTLNSPRGTSAGSGMKGVYPNKKRWMAKDCNKYLGTFDTKEQAARAYNIAAREKYGEHAVLNDIPDPLGEGAPI